MIQGLSVTKERNLLPLAVQSDTEAKWSSSNTRDQLFGTFHTAKGTQWTGASLWNPQPPAATMEKCVQWDNAASLEDDATLTTVLAVGYFADECFLSADRRKLSAKQPINRAVRDIFKYKIIYFSRKARKSSPLRGWGPARCRTALEQGISFVFTCSIT